MNSYLHGPSLMPLLGETIGENLRRTVERCGDREALVVRWQGYRAKYRELWEQTTALARALLASGVQKGDRVGIISFGADRRTCSPPRLVAVRRSKLVVGVVLDARFVAGGRATMQQQHLHLRVVADAGPDVKRPFRLAHAKTIARETAKTAHFTKNLLAYF